MRTMADRLPAAGFDLVATNPPYRLLDDSNPSPDRERALAHHEISLRLSEWLDVAARAVRPGGRVAAVLPHSRARELVRGMGTRGLRPVRMRYVHPYADRPPARVLVEAEHGGERVSVIDLPLVVHDPGGAYTAEVAQMLRI